ncbi:TPM domain-containing protein [uncultured Brachyspira sp.]|uniref:TPM domain-containing protein n=1 Tax=uncultured Brachyspira sp. TaxID=221953 RepID=UPI0026285382|nr:TPM domain-containing protein [uncultured Brachyspira sp.]
MLTKIKNILLWPFKVDDASFSAKGFKTSFLVLIFLIAVLFSLYKAGKYYYDIYYLPIDAEMAVEDFFIQDKAEILKNSHNAGFPYISAAVNLHFNSIKEKPQIVTIVEPDLTENETEEARANKLFNEIGIGSAEYNNGVLIYVNGIYDFSFKIEVGYGLEDVITDSKAGIILDNAFNKIGGKENLSDDNINEVLVYTFIDIANIIAEKYNVNISQDLKQQSFSNIKYYEPLDNLGLFLKYYMIAACCIIILLIFSKRYAAMIIFFPAFVIMLIELILNTGVFAFTALIFLPVVLSIYMSDSDTKSDKKNKKDKENQIDGTVQKNQDDKLNHENISQDNILLENSETANNVQENDVTENIDKDNTKKSISKNLLTLTFIPQKNKFDFSNMPYQFVLFYSSLFFIVSLYVMFSFNFINFKAVEEEIINKNEATVEEKLKMYTNTNGLAGYYKEGNNTYVLDDSFAKELYGINYLFQQNKYKPKIAAVFINEASLNGNISTEKLFSKYNLDKLENNNGLLIVYYYNSEKNESRIDMIAGNGLKSILSEYYMEDIKKIALEYAYHGEELYMDSDFTVIEPDNYSKQMFMRTIEKAEKTLGSKSEINAEQQAEVISSLLGLVDKDNELSRMRMILSYKQNGNCIQVLREAVKQSVDIIAKAYNIKINDEKLLSYYTIPYEYEVSKKSIYALLEIIMTAVFFIILFAVIIFVRSFRKVALYGLVLAVASAFALDIGSFLTDILVGIVVVLMIGFGIVSDIFSKNGSSGGGSYRSSSSSRRSGSSSSFGGFSRSSRSFGGGGRSGGGGVFRR